MDLSSMLSDGHHEADSVDDTRKQYHQHAIRNGLSSQEAQPNAKPYTNTSQRPLRGNGAAASPASVYARGSPAKKDQKHVLFQLVGQQDARIQARLPMRVMISPHDNTDSIIASVRNFYGLYDHGVSFETWNGISIIAAWDNFDNDMTIYVRTVPLPPASEHARDSVSPHKKAALGAPFEMRPPVHSPSRSAVRSAGFRSMSPQSDRGKRSASAAPGHRPRYQKTKSKDNNVMGDQEGYSSDNNDNGSVASSRRSKVEEIKAEITVDNIVEGGRRKRAFESSELPLFVPPQVPMNASTSSISPQRRAGPPNASPYGNANQHTFSYNQALPSPQSYNNGFGYALPSFPGNPYQSGFPPPPRQLRGGRASGGSYTSNRNSIGGILPTPDPTIGSVISDEDVALQLMRLGDPMAFSHGRTSTSTVDDALSGKAEAASSDEEGEEEEEEEEDSVLPTVPAFEDVGPQRKKQRTANEPTSDGTSGEEYEDHRDGTFRGESDGIHGDEGQRKMGKPKSKARNGSVAMGKPAKPRALSVAKTKNSSMGSAHMHAHPTVPISPASLPPQSRKASISSTIAFQHHLGADEEDLSSKPRCQRCRKSKKGCDRQRPCGRCKDAGIGVDGCVSEDEGNGRKGRYGRHMGVTIKKADGSIGDEEDTPPLQQIQPQLGTAVPANGLYLAHSALAKDKKRKR